MLFKSTRVKTLSYCWRKGSAFDSLFLHTRFFQKSAGIFVASERKSLIYNLSMPILVVPSEDGTMLPITSLTYLARESRMRIDVLLRTCLKAFRSWALPELSDPHNCKSALNCLYQINSDTVSQDLW